MPNERFMRHHYGASGFDKAKAEKFVCPTCGNTKIPIPESLNILLQVESFVQQRRKEYAEIAGQSNKRGLEAKKLSAECRELAYFDVMKEIERLRLVDLNTPAEEQVINWHQYAIKIDFEGRLLCQDKGDPLETWQVIAQL